MKNGNVFVLHNGVEVPEIGFGTWQMPKDVAYRSVTDALEVGYTHIDTAWNYGNETTVGQAIRDFDIAREDVFVTSKLPAEIKDYDQTLDFYRYSLENMGLDYLDLYLIHAPWPWLDQGGDYTEGNIQAWKAMEQLFKEGKVRAIGVSNFSVSDLQAILDNCEIKPMVNQIPYYIGRDQKDVLAFCKEHDILVEAYSPLATGDILNHPVLQDIAKKYGKSVAQICIKYCLQMGTLPLPKTTHKERAIENSQMDFEISEEDMAKLNQLEDVRKQK